MLQVDHELQITKRTKFRRDLRCTIADFSVGRIPRYEIDTFPTPEGTLGIKLFPEVQLGIGKESVKTKTSTNIYWFCKHLEESGWLVKDCFIGEPPKKEEKPKVIGIDRNVIKYTTTCTVMYSHNYEPTVCIIVRKVDESDIEIGNIRPKSNHKPSNRSK